MVAVGKHKPKEPLLLKNKLKYLYYTDSTYIRTHISKMYRHVQHTTVTLSPKSL